MKIRVYRDNDNYSDHLVTAEPLVIGRGKQSDVRIISEGVSRQHAKIHKEGDDLIIEDLASANGITINGKKVQTAKLTSLFPAHLAGDIRVEALEDMDLASPKRSRPRPVKAKLGPERRGVSPIQRQAPVELNKNFVTVLIVFLVITFFYFLPTKSKKNAKEMKGPPQTVTKEKVKTLEKTKESIELCKSDIVRPICLAFRVQGKRGFGFRLKEAQVIGNLDYRKILDKRPGVLSNDQSLKIWIAEKLNAGIFKDLARENIDNLIINFSTKVFKKEIPYKQAVIEVKRFYGATVLGDGSLPYGREQRSRLKNYIAIKKL